MAVATDETQHITRMVSQQKRTKKNSKVINILTLQSRCLIGSPTVYCSPFIISCLYRAFP